MMSDTPRWPTELDLLARARRSPEAAGQILAMLGSSPTKPDLKADETGGSRSPQGERMPPSKAAKPDLKADETAGIRHSQE